MPINIIGVTGPSGAGKSRFCDLLKKYNIPSIDADALYHSMLASGSRCTVAIAKEFGDGMLDKELQENPCHTVGLMTSGDQNDHNTLRCVAVQGFKYGFVFGEHVVADYLYVHNCEEGIVFHDSSHLTHIQHVVAQHNRCILSTTRTELFGHRKGPCLVTIGSISYESGHGIPPIVSQLQYGVYDPEKRLHGSLSYRVQDWGGMREFPVVCGEKFIVKPY